MERDPFSQQILVQISLNIHAPKKKTKDSYIYNTNKNYFNKINID